MHRLRELIASRGMSQKQFALELGYTNTAVNNWVCGKRTPDIETVGRLCDYFGCTTDYFLNRSDVPYSAVTDADAQLLQTYHALPLEIRRAVDGLMAPYRQAAEQKTGS